MSAHSETWCTFHSKHVGWTDRQHFFSAAVRPFHLQSTEATGWGLVRAGAWSLCLCCARHECCGAMPALGNWHPATVSIISHIEHPCCPCCTSWTRGAQASGAAGPAGLDTCRTGRHSARQPGQLPSRANPYVAHAWAVLQFCERTAAVPRQTARPAPSFVTLPSAQPACTSTTRLPIG